VVHTAVCSERRVFIPDETVDRVAETSGRILGDLGLKVRERRAAGEGETTIFAAEGAAIPLIMRVLLIPFRAADYVKAAQRTGVHVVISPAEGGVNLFACGIALGEASGKPERYPEENTMEEVTDTLKAWDFEGSFIEMIKSAFPGAEEE